MDILETLKADYQRFPVNQTYSIYAKDVYFQDAVFKFRGLELYKWMIKFIQTFFLNLKMDLHNIQQQENTIKTEWTLSWDAALPWKPRISISGWSELRLNNEGLIISHIDYWHCSQLDVLKQHLFSRNKG
ncbi:MAG: DUF2358 domain-containing protein [Sphaerospermopsis kisseleviana]|uniref:DUF2358 domain-containing protein n=4 Tax=Sphaerospermopsis TaxID=752201 RepID=A0A479ZXG3_9CYAN|nr:MULTISPECIES: DUF2358 domain-containing protein [Sphaerospermopsis]MEB3149981.1 DUF2358 domain-containing protein [Sphaerospermopsis sp.]BAZ82503.1 hypothetical protein NIES73_37850 [Sphaerospermopsis kisseleviana NIES-73]MBD2133565.1 DUF2358 domain-containing protein [Sphaerospermopsis sp. FACHB-1094]MBD2143728.1 DUF2358 domain-containing protein [Sphaerospermopsis sp. FACHB-1194]MBE9235398.1 DUF2358 domain-containing protein [Sphaerospermopsis aphanizomenoides LEGE 00250]